MHKPNIQQNFPMSTSYRSFLAIHRKPDFSRHFFYWRQYKSLLMFSFTSFFVFIRKQKKMKYILWHDTAKSILSISVHDKHMMFHKIKSFVLIKNHSLNSSNYFGTNFSIASILRNSNKLQVASGASCQCSMLS